MVSLGRENSDEKDKFKQGIYDDRSKRAHPSHTGRSYADDNGADPDLRKSEAHVDGV